MLSIIQKTHKDRYRKVFCDTDFYNNNQKQFQLWKTLFRPFSNVEKVQAWVVALSCLRRPDNWFGGIRHDSFLDNTGSYQHPLTLGKLFSDTAVRIPAKIDVKINLIDFINRYKIKAFPESCSRSLCYISNQRYPLIITEKIPTPHELLQIQISRKRIISINENHEEWPETFYSDRDFLGFVMHDLIHADHFFKNTEHRDGQLGFYSFINKILDDRLLINFLNTETFRTGFEYIISDMNSHPVHLFQTLHALLYTEIKDDTAARHCWTNWIKICDLAESESAALMAVNSTFFNSDFARNIEILCIRLGKQTST